MDSQISSDDSENSLESFMNDLLMLDTEFSSICPKFVQRERQSIPKSNWWEFVYPRLQPSAYKKIYRMRKETVQRLTQVLYSFTNNSDFKYNTRSKFHKAICVCLRYLTRHKRQFDLQFDYNCSGGYINMYFKDVVYLIINHLSDQVMSWPNLDERKLANDIYNVYNISCSLGCLDGTFIYCKGYGETPANYTCRKFDFSMNVILVNDHNLLIRHFISNNVGAKGDNEIIEQSDLSRLIPSILAFKHNGDHYNNSIGLLRIL
eukprot:NODE_220_length_12432_cov_0.484878.p4 type:complete len:262 gc:universal NODE_220_length_12432_cov_0.484878:2705-3490(+)